jgi:Protein of unknown function (DUF2934)
MVNRVRRVQLKGRAMKECLVDVLNGRDTVLHVFPIAVEERDSVPKDAECLQEAMKVATDLHLVPEEETDGLHARMHVSRGGQLAPFGDVLEVRHQSQERAEQHVRTRAYFLWQQEGCPENRAEEHWYQACELEGHSSPS